jgi:5-methylcytosine-specific restriction enzyme A
MLVDAVGGPWYTGLVRHDDAYFIFCNVGIAGRTGHDYGNYFDGDELDWSGASTSHKDQPAIKAITTVDTEVHVFYRVSDHDLFTYAGRASAIDVSDSKPVRVVWRFSGAGDGHALASGPQKHMEGGKKTVAVTVVERNPKARRECLEHHGAVCKVCDFNFGTKYGDLGIGFMHVHHLTQVSTYVNEVEVNALTDLAPVCPNCHAMLHRRKPPYSLTEMKEIIAINAAKVVSA